MPAGKFNFEIEQGVDLIIPIVVKNDDGTPYNLTDADARMQLRACVGSSTILDDLTTANDRIMIGEVVKDGVTYWEIALNFTSSITSAYAFDKAVYDLELISGEGQVIRLLQGEIIVSKEVTR